LYGLLSTSALTVSVKRSKSQCGKKGLTRTGKQLLCLNGFGFRSSMQVMHRCFVCPTFRQELQELKRHRNALRHHIVTPYFHPELKENALFTDEARTTI